MVKGCTHFSWKITSPDSNCYYICGTFTVIVRPPCFQQPSKDKKMIGRLLYLKKKPQTKTNNGKQNPSYYSRDADRFLWICQQNVHHCWPSKAWILVISVKNGGVTFSLWDLNHNTDLLNPGLVLAVGPLPSDLSELLIHLWVEDWKISFIF